MWQEAKANDRRDLMANHKRRAERRRAYHESRLGDPQQLLRVIGSSLKLYPDAEQFYYHENPENLMSWQGNPDIKIDRFDGRSLLDFAPDPAQSSRENNEDSDELNFERYRDLIEANRLNIEESERLAQVEEEWTKLLDRHQAKLALINKSNSKGRSNTIGFDYGTTKVVEDDTKQNETSLIYETDILEYVDDLTDKDKEILNSMSAKYGVKSYARLLRVAKKDRDAELKVLKKKQDEGMPKDPSTKKGRKKRKRRRRRGDYLEGRHRYRRRHSPSYEPYRNGSSSGSSDDSSSGEEEDTSSDDSDFVIEFSSNAPEETAAVEQTQETEQSSQKIEQEKKLTPMEKLKLKMRAGLEKQIVSDERDKRQKEREREVQQLQQLAKSQGLPIHSYMRPDPPTRPTGERYRSPSSSPERKPKKYRSPSSSPTRPSSSRGKSPSHEDKSTQGRYRSPSSEREKSTKDHYRSSSSSRERSKKRYRSPPSPRERSNKERYSSPSSSRKRYRSPSKERSSSRRYRSNSRERSSRRRYDSRSPPKYSKRRRSPEYSRRGKSPKKRSRSRESSKHYRKRY
ncbi:unnamed protein product [Rhizopus stolonifer]